MEKTVNAPAAGRFMATPIRQEKPLSTISGVLTITAGVLPPAVV